MVTALRLPAFSCSLGAGQCQHAHQALGVSRPTRSSSPRVSCRPLGEGNLTVVPSLGCPGCGRGGGDVRLEKGPLGGCRSDADDRSLG